MRKLVCSSRISPLANRPRNRKRKPLATKSRWLLMSANKFMQNGAEVAGFRWLGRRLDGLGIIGDEQMTRQQWLAQWFPSDDRTESNDKSPGNGNGWGRCHFHRMLNPFIG